MKVQASIKVEEVEGGERGVGVGGARLTRGLHLVLLLVVALTADVVEGEEEVVLLVELDGQLNLDLKPRDTFIHSQHTHTHTLDQHFSQSN